MITYITTLILFVLLSSLEGLEQAFYYHSSVITGDSNKYNLHPIFFVQRGIVAIFIALSTSCHIAKPMLAAAAVNLVEILNNENGKYKRTKT